MAVQIDELIFQARLDSSRLDQETDRAVNRTANRFATLNLLGAPAPKVDLRGLHELNAVIDSKIDHWGQLGALVSEGIRPTVDLRSLESGLNAAQRAVELLRADVANVESKVCVSVEGMDSAREAINDLRASLEDQFASIEVHADTTPAEEALRDLRFSAENPIRIRYDNSEAPDALTRDVFGHSYRVKMYAESGDMRSLSREVSHAVRDGMGGGFGDAMLDILTSPVRAVKSMMSSVARGFFQEIGAGLSDGVGARRTARQQGARAGNFARTVDQELVGLNEVVPAFLSELTHSGDIKKASKYSAQYMKSTKVIANLQKMAQVATFGDDQNQIVNIPELMELIPPEDLDMLKQLGGKAYLAKKGRKSEVSKNVASRLESLLVELNPTSVVSNVINPILQELSGPLALINKIQVHRSISQAHRKADKLEPLFPNFQPAEKGLLNIIGGAQNKKGRGFEELVTSFEPIIEGRKIIGVANPQTDHGGELPKGSISEFIRDLVIKTAPQLKTGPMASTLNNIALMVERTVNPLFEDSTVSDALANSLVAKRKGVKDKDISTISYSLGGAPARDVASGYQSLGMDSKVIALAYPDLNAYKPDLPNFRAMQLEEDAISFPKTVLGLGSKANYHQYTANLPKGSETHAYNHLFKSPELQNDFFSYLGLQDPGGDIPHVLNINTNTQRSLQSSRQVKSIINTGQFAEGSQVGTTNTAMNLMQFVAERLARQSVNEAGSPKQIAVEMAVREELQGTYELMAKHLESLGLPAEHLTNPAELNAYLSLRAESGGINKSLTAMATGEGHGDDAWFAGGGDPAVVRARIESATKAAEYFAKLLGQTSPSAIKLRSAFEDLAVVMAEYAETGKLSAETIANLKPLEVATTPGLTALTEMRSPHKNVPFEDQRKYNHPNAQPWMYSSPPAVLAYNKMLRDTENPSVIPPIEEIKIAAHGMSGATALLTNDFVYKNDLHDEEKIASKTEIAAYKKLAGRYSPLMYHAEEGKLMVTERAKGTPLKDVLNEEAKPSINAMARYQEAKAQYSEAKSTEDPSHLDGLAKIKEAQNVMKAARSALAKERKIFNDKAVEIYKQVGTLGNTLQSMGVAHMDLAAGNVFMQDDGSLSAIDLGNSIADPSPFEKFQDQMTTIQRAIIDRDYYGILDINRVAGAVRSGYSKELPIVPKRVGTIDDLPRFDESRDRQIELGSSQQSELQELVNYERFMPEAQKLSADGRMAKANRDADKAEKKRAAAQAEYEKELETWRSQQGLQTRKIARPEPDPWFDPFAEGMRAVMGDSGDDDMQMPVKIVPPPPPSKMAQQASAMARTGASAIGTAAQTTGKELVNAFQELYHAAKSIENAAFQILPLATQTKALLTHVVAPLMAAHAVAQIPAVAPIAELGAGAVKGLLDIPVSQFIEMPGAQALEAMQGILPDVSIPGIGNTAAVTEALQTFLREQLASGASIISETVGGALASLLGGKTVLNTAKTLGAAGVEKLLGEGSLNGNQQRNAKASGFADGLRQIIGDNIQTSITPLIPPAPPTVALPPASKFALMPSTGPLEQTARHQRELVKTMFEGFKAQSKPLASARSRAVITEGELRAIAIAYLQVKDYALSAMQTITGSIDEINRMMASTNDPAVRQQLQSVKTKLAGLKGNVVSYVADSQGQEAGSYLGKRMKLIEQVPPEKLQFYDETVAEIGGEAAKRGIVNPDILKATKRYKPNDEGFSRRQVLTAGTLAATLAAIATPIVSGASIASAGAGSIATATALMTAVAPLAPAIGAALLGTAAVATTAKAVGSGVGKVTPTVRALVTKIIDSIQNKIKFGKPFDRKISVPIGEPEPPELDPAYNKAWGEYYDKRALGLTASQPKTDQRPSHAYNFQSASTNSGMDKVAWISFLNGATGGGIPDEPLMAPPAKAIDSFGDFDEDFGKTSDLKSRIASALKKKKKYSVTRGGEEGFGITPNIAIPETLKKIIPGIVKKALAVMAIATVGVGAMAAPAYDPVDALGPKKLINIQPTAPQELVSQEIHPDTYRAREARRQKLESHNLKQQLTPQNFLPAGSKPFSLESLNLPKRDFHAADQPIAPQNIIAGLIASTPIAGLIGLFGIDLFKKRRSKEETEETDSTSPMSKLKEALAKKAAQKPRVNPLAPLAPSKMPGIESSPLVRAAQLARDESKPTFIQKLQSSAFLGRVKQVATTGAIFAAIAATGASAGFLSTMAIVNSTEQAVSKASTAPLSIPTIAKGIDINSLSVAGQTPPPSVGLSEKNNLPPNSLLGYLEEQQPGLRSGKAGIGKIGQFFAEEKEQLTAQVSFAKEKALAHRIDVGKAAKDIATGLMPGDYLAALLAGGLAGLNILRPGKKLASAEGGDLPEAPRRKLEIPKLRLPQLFGGKKIQKEDGVEVGENSKGSALRAFFASAKSGPASNLYDLLGQGAEAADSKMGKLYNTIKLVASAVGITLSSGLLLGMAAGLLAVSKAALQASAQYELFQYQAANAVGSRSGGRQLVQRSDRLANERGLSLNTQRESNIQFQAATKDTPYQGEIAQFVSDSISKAAVIRGLDAQQTQRATIGFLQAFGKEEIQPEEIRGQIAESGFYDIQPVLARSLGVSTSSIDKLSRTNQLGTPELLKLVSTLNADADGSGLDPGKTLNASFNRLGNSGQNFMESLGGSLKLAQPLIEGVASSINLLAKVTESSGTIVGGALLSMGTNFLLMAVKSSISAIQASSAMGMVVNAAITAGRLLSTVFLPLALGTIAIEAFSISINNLSGKSAFSEIASNIESSAMKIKEAADIVNGIKPLSAPTATEEEKKKEANKGNWGQQALDFIAPALNGAGGIFAPNVKLKTQAEYNEQTAKSDLFEKILPGAQSSIDNANTVIGSTDRIRKLAELRDQIAQNKIAQDRTDETPEGRAEFEKLKKDQGRLEVEKLRIETPFTQAESNLEATKKGLQEAIDKGAVPEQRKALEGLIKDITVTQERFKTVSSAVSELTRTFNRTIEMLARYDRSLSQARARIAIQGSADTGRIYQNRAGADNDVQLQLDQKSQGVANDERSLAAIQDDLARRTVAVAKIKQLVGSDVIKLDPVKDKSAYDQVISLDAQVAKLRAQSAQLAKTGDSEDLTKSFEVDSQALKLEQEADALRNSKSNLVFNAEKVQKVKEAEDKILELQQEAADKSASITRGKVERRIAIEQTALSELAKLYNLAGIRDATSAANYQASVVPIRPFEEKARLGFREAQIGVGVASQNLNRETQNRDALKGLLDSGKIKLTAEEGRLALAQADQKVAETRKSLLEAEKAAVVSMAALAAREVERIKAKVEAMNAQIDRDLSIAQTKNTRASLTPVNLKESLLAVDISDTTQKLAELKNQQMALDAAKAQNNNRYNNLQSTPENLQELTRVIGRTPGEASLQELMVAKDRYDALATKTPETEQQSATVNQLIEIQQKDVDIEQKKTELAKSANSLQLEIKTKMKELANAQAALMKSIADETISINDSIRQAAAQLKQSTITNRLKDSLLGVSGFMGDFVDSIVGLVEKISTITEAEREKTIQANRSKLRFVGDQDKNDQQRRKLVAETSAVFGGSSAITAETISRQTTPTLVSTERDGPAYRDGETAPTRRTGGRRSPLVLVPDPTDTLQPQIPQTGSSGYQVNPSAGAAAATVQQRTGDNEAVRAVLANGQKIISTVAIEMTRYGTAVDRRRAVEGDLAQQEIRAAINATESQTIKIIRDMNATVLSTQRESIAARFGDRELVRSSRRSNYQDQLEATRDEGLKSFLDAQNAIDDQSRSLRILLVNAKKAPEKLLELVDSSALDDKEKSKVRGIVQQFGADSKEATAYLEQALRDRDARRATLPGLYEGTTNLKLREQTEARSIKVQELTTSSQAGLLRARAEAPEVNRFQAATLVGQANLLEADSAYRRDLLALTKELEGAGLAGTDAGEAILSNFSRLNDLKLDKIRNEMNLLGKELESSLTNSFSDGIMGLGDVGADAFQRLLWPEKFTTEKWRSIGDGIVDVLKSLGSNVLKTMAKISADAAATSIGKWLQGGMSGFLNGILGIPTTPAKAETPIIPAVETKAEALSIPRVLQSNPSAIINMLESAYAAEPAVRPEGSSPAQLEAFPRPSAVLRDSQSWQQQQREDLRNRGLPAFIPVPPVTGALDSSPVVVTPAAPQILNATLGNTDSRYQAAPGSNQNEWLVPPPPLRQEIGQDIGQGFLDRVRGSEVIAPLDAGRDIGDQIGPGQYFQIESPGSKPKGFGKDDVSKVEIDQGGKLGRDMAIGFKEVAGTFASNTARSVAAGGDLGASAMATGTNYLIGAGAKGLGNLAGDVFRSIFKFADGGKMTDGAPVRIQQFAMGGKASSQLGGYDPDQINRAIAAEGNGLLAVVHPGEWMLSDRTGDAQLFESMLDSGEWADRKSHSVPQFAMGGKGDGTAMNPRSRSGGGSSGTTNVDNSMTIQLYGVSTASADFGYNQQQLKLRQTRENLRNS
jgi:tape measure domain-containing protein